MSLRGRVAALKALVARVVKPPDTCPECGRDRRALPRPILRAGAEDLGKPVGRGCSTCPPVLRIVRPTRAPTGGRP